MRAPAIALLVALVVGRDGYAISMALPDTPTGGGCAERGGWSEVPLENVSSAERPGTLAEIASNDIWMVSHDYFGGSITRHWDGSRWQFVPAAHFPEGIDQLFAVDGSATDVVWAVGRIGRSTLAERWNGAEWEHVPTPSVGKRDNVLTGVSVVSAEDAWAVGRYDVAGSGPRILILRWDGSDWSVFPSAPMSKAQMHAVDALSGSDAWAVGEANGAALALHWDGSSWAGFSTPTPGDSSTLFAVDARSSDDVWSVGSFNDGPTEHAFVLHWDGSEWQQLESPGQYMTLVAVDAEDGEVWVGGDSGGGSTGAFSVFHWDGQAWTLAFSAYDHFGDLERIGDTDVLVTANQYQGEGDFEAKGFLFCPIEVRDREYRPSVITLAQSQGQHVWWFPPSNRRPHTVTDGSGMNLFDSGRRHPGSIFMHAFVAAGSYEILDEVRGYRGVVNVPLYASALDPTTAQDVTVRWALLEPPTGFVYDAELRLPGAEAYVPWTEGVRTLSAIFDPDRPGVHEFRARMRELSSGRSIGWSPSIAIDVRALESDLAVSLQHQPDQFRVGEDALMVVNVLNQGPKTADDIVLTIETPQSFEILDIESSSGSCSLGQDPVCSLGDLRPGSQALVTVQVRPDDPGLFDWAALATSSSFDPDSTDNSAADQVRVLDEGCTIVGTEGPDVLQGTEGDDVICALYGDDEIRPGGGDDVVLAGYGNDRIHPSEGRDRLVGGPGDDRLAGGPEGDDLDGGGGFDVLDGGGRNGPVRGRP